MPQVRDVLTALEQIAPTRFAFEFDKVGLQVGDLHVSVLRAAVSLDRSLGAISFAAQENCQLLVSHHPLIFSPLETVDTGSHVGRSVVELLKQGISFIAAHTNWDCARGGVNDELARLLDLREVADFGTGAKVSGLKLVFFVPTASANAVVDAVSEAGGGLIGKYSRCAYLSSGTGTFVGQPDSRPAVGSPELVEEVREFRVEMAVSPEGKRSVTKALLKSHPYQEPAYDFYALESRVEAPDGRVGLLPSPMTLKELASHLDQVLETRSWTWGDPGEKIRRVAVVGGAADGEWMAAQRAGADVLVTGEVKQHVAVEASESGMPLVASGHFATEHPGAAALKLRLQDALPEIEWLLYAPAPGHHGRPL